MKNTKQQYKLEEFDKHISLWNCIPAAQGNSLTLLRKIVNGIQSGNFARNPSLIIANEGAKELAIATANSLCSSDIREIESKYLFNVKTQIDYFSDSCFDTIHIIYSVNRIGLTESVLWQFIKNRGCKFPMMDNSVQHIHCHGVIIIVADEIKSIPLALIDAIDFKVIIEPYTQEQLELIVHQRLHFCGIDYGGDEEVLTTILEYCQGEIWRIKDLLKICVLLAQEADGKLNVKLIERASKLI
jgi:hypothetical protein